jgi:hypothetical protein
MPNDLSKIVGAATRLLGGDGKEYKLSPLSIDELADIDEWLAKRIVTRVRIRYADAPADMRDAALRQAFVQSETISFSTPDGVALLETPEGIRELLFHSLRVAHPTITLADVGQIVTAHSIEDIRKQINAVNDLGPTPPPTSN